MDTKLASILIEYLKGEISYEEASRIIEKNIKKAIEEEIKERFNEINTSN